MRYRPEQHLIGAGVFPFYWLALKTAIVIAFIVHVIVAFATSLSQDAPQLILPRLFGFPGVAIQVFGWVTLAFAAMDFWQAKLHLFDKWSPRSLPRATNRSPRPSRTGLMAELVGGVLFLAWWLAVPTYPFLMLGPAASFLALSPAFHRVYLSATLPAIVSLLMIAAVFAWPSWTILSRVRPLLVNLATLFVLSVLLQAGDLLMPTIETPDLVHMVKGINGGITLVLLIVSIGTVIQTMYEVSRGVAPGARERR
jgi:hypothetical protein